MHLSKLLNRPLDAPQNIEITGITADSRHVKPGYIFAAIPGAKANGSVFIEDALMHGAVAVLAASGTKLPDHSTAVLIEDKNPRLALAQIASRFYAAQPETIVAVTGTSGKTSSVNFTQQLWDLCGIERSVSLGTLGLRGAGMARSGSLTTPDTVSLHAALADLAAAGITHLALEASSHGLDQYRLDGVKIGAAGYTNLSRDHLDYHSDMDEYFAAKSRLFSEVMQRGGTAVLNADEDRYDALRAICEKAGHKIISYGHKDSDLQILCRSLEPEGQNVKLSVFGAEYDVGLPLVGEFQVMNALCALGLVLAGGLDAAKIVPLLAKLSGVPGRLQLVPEHSAGAAVYVDYAHKPAAVEAVLNALRPHTKGRLVCLLGCGGDRDAGKRPVMGRIAAELSDLVVVTDDNPRSENPATIRAAIMEAAPGAKEIGGRREAIEWAVNELREGDVLVIAGKGHEQGQIIGDRVEPFDDVEIAKEYIQKLEEKKA